MTNSILFIGLLFISFLANANSPSTGTDNASHTNNGKSSLKSSIISLEHKTHGQIGVAVLNTQNGQHWSYRGNQRFALMSTFKTLACAKMLADSDKNILNTRQTVVIDKTKIITWSPVTEHFIGEQMSLKKLCEAAMLKSDNTAINLVLSNIGDPAAVTQFLQQHGDPITRIDRNEPELNSAIVNDPRDTSTPLRMVNTLNDLLYGDVLSNDSKAQLKSWMIHNQMSDSLLRSILPADYFIADRSGAGNNGSRGITAVIWNKQTKPIIISIYLTQTQLNIQERDKIIVEVGKAILQKYSIK